MCNVLRSAPPAPMSQDPLDLDNYPATHDLITITYISYRPIYGWYLGKVVSNIRAASSGGVIPLPPLYTKLIHYSAIPSGPGATQDKLALNTPLLY